MYGKVCEIEADLKMWGLVALSGSKELAYRSDQAFPNGDSCRIVDFEGERYKRRYTPRGKSLSARQSMGPKVLDEYRRSPSRQSTLALAGPRRAGFFNHCPPSLLFGDYVAYVLCWGSAWRYSARASAKRWS